MSHRAAFISKSATFCGVDLQFAGKTPAKPDPHAPPSYRERPPTASKLSRMADWFRPNGNFATNAATASGSAGARSGSISGPRRPRNDSGAKNGILAGTVMSQAAAKTTKPNSNTHRSAHAMITKAKP
jgi:hypothetical protein